MRELTYYTLDVFTDSAFGGNPLAVIPESPALDHDLMQAIAREFNYPETVFVHPVDTNEALYRLRIFTPGSELPFAGHPTIGTAQLLAELGMAPPSVNGTTEFLLEEGIGLVPVSVSIGNDSRYFTWLTAPRLPEAGATTPSNTALAAVLGLEPEMIGAAGPVAPAVYSAGVPFTFVPVRDRAALQRIHFDISQWRATLATTEAPQLYAFCRGGSDGGPDFHARMFAPALGVPEDPATGAAAVALAGYLCDATGCTGRQAIAQGEDMQRPSTIHIDMDASDNHLRAVRVGGSAVRVCHGTLRLP